MIVLAIDPGTTESAYVKPRVNYNGTVYGDPAKDGLTAQQRYHARNREKRNRQSRDYRERHLAENAARMRDYRKRKPDVIAKIERNRKRPEGWRQKFNAYHREWSKLNPDKRLASYQKRRALAGAAIPSRELTALRDSQDGKCFYCSAPLDNNGRGHLEHKTPLARGGEHVVANLCFACSPCNLRKGTKTEEEFRA